jgi:hypothetical protein
LAIKKAVSIAAWFVRLTGRLAALQALLLKSRTDPDLRSLADATRDDGVPRSTW